jgi:hypothetical protein
MSSKLGGNASLRKSKFLLIPRCVFWKQGGLNAGKPYRTLYAFDPVRSAILLLGGDKTGDGRWYEKNVPLADDLYDDHIEQLRKEGLING